MAERKSAKFKQLPGACPAAVQYPADLREKLGGVQYTEEIYPVSLEQYQKMLKRNMHVSKGLRKAVESITNDDGSKKYDLKSVVRGLPLCFKDGEPAFCTVIDSDGNVCMQGARELDETETENRLNEQKRKLLNDESLIMEAGKKLQTNYENRDTEKYTKISKLIKDFKEIKQKKYTRPVAMKQLTKGLKHLIRSEVSGDENPTGGCMSIYGKDEHDFSEYTPEDGRLGENPDERKTVGLVPVTHLEKENKRYRLGRVPIQTGSTAQSVVCVPPSDRQFQKSFPIFANLLKRVEQPKQNENDMKDRSIVYKDDDVVKHATQAMICADLSQKDCTSEIPYAANGAKMPFGRSDKDVLASNAKYCEWDRLPTQPNKPRQCIPKFENNSVRVDDEEYGAEYWDWYDKEVIGNRINGKGRYSRFAEERMRDPKNKIQYKLQSPKDDTINTIAERAAGILRALEVPAPYDPSEGPPEYLTMKPKHLKKYYDELMKSNKENMDDAVKHYKNRVVGEE
tara:strand:- start:135 stop:1667 length:1533 start_codon:yes stop_codon:yes gene_type:complete